MSLAWYKTVVESVINHEQSAAESSTVMVQRCRSSVVRILPDYIVGPPNLRILLTVNHVAAELLRLVRTSQSDTVSRLDSLHSGDDSSIACLVTD